MDYQPRTIAFISEVFHPPKAPDPRPIQKLHNAMFEGGHPTYASFAVTPGGPVLSNVPGRPGAVSQVAFLADRIQFREELGGATPDSFASRVVEVVRAAAPLRELSVLTGHQVTLRSLINPRHFADTRKFLRDGVFGFTDEVEAFQRRPELYGLRLLFPAEGDEPNAFAVRIESYGGDPRSLYVEIKGSFGPAIAAHEPDPLGANVHETYRFLEERALPFVARFDAHQPS